MKFIIQILCTPKQMKGNPHPREQDESSQPHFGARDLCSQKLQFITKSSLRETYAPNRNQFIAKSQMKGISIHESKKKRPYIQIRVKEDFFFSHHCV